MQRKQINPILTWLALLSFSLGACELNAPVTIPAQDVTSTATPAASATARAQASSTPTLEAATATTSPTPTQAAPASIGPDPQDIPPGYNPLTGLPVADPTLLKLPVVLVSITNFPPSARPQAGLSFSPWVYEIYIAEGMTRYLAAFYGDFPRPASGANTGSSTQSDSSGQIGPVRSGRLPYVYIRDFFQDSCLVYAGATEEIRARLRGCEMVYGDDAADINSAMLDVTRLQQVAEKSQRPDDQFNYSGSLFTEKPQSQGAPANLIDVYYSLLNQARWQYQPETGDYLKFDDFADGSGNFTPASDRLTGKPLAFSNVIVLYVEHRVISPYIIDVKMEMGSLGKAVIFRDGQMFKATWSTVAGDYEKSSGLRRPLRFIDASGQPFGLKPGHSWVHIVTMASEVKDKGEGSWWLRFYAPAGAK